ncbi:MAG: YbhB/YbcL family Raf kinase inhibitor-like protein [Pseudomonadota bacterium]
MAFELKSISFNEGASIPSKYTCDGENISPPLSWSGAPAGTKSFALISDDPDAPVMGAWVHWVAWNIPTGSTSFKEGMDKGATLSNGTKQGMSDFKKPGYGGPCPPSGTHRYFFKLYALDTTLDLPATSTKKDLEAAMKGHILAQTQLMGTYSRNK